MEGRSRQRTAGTEAEKVIVAVRAEKLISKAALTWALTHVVRPRDCVTLLAVFPSEKRGRRFWNIPRFAGDCGSGFPEESPARIFQISESCSQMVLQIHSQIEVRVRIKVVTGTTSGAVAAEAMSNGANWVILDKQSITAPALISVMNYVNEVEVKHCINNLHCNIAVMKDSQAKVIRLNLQSTNELPTPYFSAAASPEIDFGELQGHRKKHSTPVSSPDEQIVSQSISDREGLRSCPEAEESLFLYQENPLFEGTNKRNCAGLRDHHGSDEADIIDSEGERFVSLSTKRTSSLPTDQKSLFWIAENHVVDGKHRGTQSYRSAISYPTSRTLPDKFFQYDQQLVAGSQVQNQNHLNDYTLGASFRTAVTLGRASSVPPPLCSFCKNKTPVFGKPPRQFSYEDLAEATDGFSDKNFLAEGGFGVVYRGVLSDGQVVAVKLLKFSGSQADSDFCREVRLLSCAQHRNVVLLIGFCIDGKKRVLVYEYICNRSLEFHLHGNKRALLDWPSRLRIAIGTARGLRYLHEDCRVGCIIHRDMRPNNILLTHDCEPLVTDFGLARWHSDWSLDTEEQVIGTLGYLAPEYLDGGRVTPKVDVYAFGVVLLELLTGQKIGRLQLYMEQNFPSDWFNPRSTLHSSDLLRNVYQLLDPYLTSVQDHNHQLNAMVCAASLCLCHEPESRPQMSKVLRILEGGDMVIPLAVDLKSVGNRSGHLSGLSSQLQSEDTRGHSRGHSH